MTCRSIVLFRGCLLILSIKRYVYVERAVEVCEERMFCVLLAEDGLVRRYAPVYSEGGVEDADASVCLRMVEIVALVLEHGFFAEHCEAVGETARYEELAVVVLRQFYGYVLSVCRTALAYIYGNIEHRTLDAAHELALSERRALEMKAAHDAVARLALIVLNEMYLAHLCVEVPLAVALEEISAGIVEHARFDDEHTVYVCLYCFHINPFTFLM